MEKKYRAVLRDLFQVVIGEVISETKDKLVLKRPCILGIQANGTNMNIQFVPFDLINGNPPISLKSILDNDAEITDFVFYKSQLIHDDVPVNPQIFDGYVQSLQPKPQIITPPNAGGIVDLNGNPVSEQPPVVQNLFS